MALGLHPCVTRTEKLQALLEAGLVEGDYLSIEVYNFLNFGMYFVNSYEGHEYWYQLNPRAYWGNRPPRPVRPWTNADREKIERYLGYATQPEEDIWL
jgi:hypothetical protein